MDESKTKISKTSVAEFLSLQLIKYAVNPNPITSIIGVFCDGLNTLQMNNIIEVLKELKIRIDYIEEKTQIKLHFDTPVFTDDILPTLQKAKDELNTQKRKLYATFIAACIHPDNLNCSNKVIFSNYLERLDYLSIYILNAVKNFVSERQLVEKTGGEYSKNMILVHLLNLKSLGLVDEINGEEYIKRIGKSRGNIGFLHPERVFLYKRSRLGSEFLTFIIKGIPEND